VSALRLDGGRSAGARARTAGARVRGARRRLRPRPPRDAGRSDDRAEERVMDTLLQDLRYAVRTLAKSPGFTTVAVLTLAVGVGARTAVYMALERVVLDPLPYPEAGRLVQLKSAVPGVAPGAEWNVSAGAWVFFRDQARTIDALGTYQRSGSRCSLRMVQNAPERPPSPQVC